MPLLFFRSLERRWPRISAETRSRSLIIRCKKQQKQQAVNTSHAPPKLAEAAAVAQQPIEADQGVAALDRALVEQSFDFGEGFDDDADVFVLFRQAVHAAGGRCIDPAAEQENAFVGAAGRGQIALDRDRLADQREPGFLLRFADRDGRGRLAAVDEAGGRLELPGELPASSAGRRNCSTSTTLSRSGS